jgi:hypothetical protein
MGVLSRWASREEGRLPTLVDFSTNSGWNSVLVLLVSIMHTRKLFTVSLAVS